MVSWDEVFQTLWTIEAYWKVKEKRKQDKRDKRLYIWEVLKAIKLKKQEDKKRVREAFTKGWWMFEVKNGGGYQLKEPYFTILYTIEMWEMWRKVKDMLKSMEAEGREKEVKLIEDYIKHMKLDRKSKKKK